LPLWVATGLFASGPPDQADEGRLVIPPGRIGRRVRIADVADQELWRDPSHVRGLPLTELTGLFPVAGLPRPTAANYLMETELEAVLGRSFPNLGDADKVRDAVTATVDDDRLGVPARRDGDRVVFGYPVAVLTAVRP
jgi:hypothetical protein